MRATPWSQRLRRRAARASIGAMSNQEPRPDVHECPAEQGEPPQVELFAPRDVPLGGPRAMTVRRTIPHRQRTLIGAWCFLDHYGPDDVADTGGMVVPRHPHTGLQTASWLFTGEIEHKDSAGFEALVRPGELYLMTAGRGISHSEFSTRETSILHGVQLWIALPDRSRHTAPTLQHHVPDLVAGEGWTARVFLGSLLGSTSPVETHTPLVGAELLLEAGARLEIEVDESFEHGVLPDDGTLVVDGTETEAAALAFVPRGRRRITIEAGETPVRAILIGGEPLGEHLLMWLNFVGRSHDEIVEYRDAWMREIGEDWVPGGEERYGPFPEGEPDPLPAPVLPNVRMKPRPR